MSDASMSAGDYEDVFGPTLGLLKNDHILCTLCDWCLPVYSFEQAEALIKEHLSEVHEMELLYAVEKDTLKVKPCP